MHLIDTHAHLDSDAFEGDLDTVLNASREKGVTRWINVGFNEERWESTARLASSVAGMYCMLGLHPGDADSWSPRVRQLLAERISALQPVAIGEIGIDLYWRQDNLERQIGAFREQLNLARELDLPAVIHMRAADAELLRVLRDEPALPHIHFHSFDGDTDLRTWVLQHRATVGVGGLITRRGSEELQTWVASLSQDRVVLETDAPYLKPRGIRGKRNEPAYVVKVAELLAELWDTSFEHVASLTTANAERIFRLGEEERQ